jgi:hypothetical protein
MPELLLPQALPLGAQHLLVNIHFKVPFEKVTKEYMWAKK